LLALYGLRRMNSGARGQPGCGTRIQSGGAANRFEGVALGHELRRMQSNAKRAVATRMALNRFAITTDQPGNGGNRVTRGDESADFKASVFIENRATAARHGWTPWVMLRESSLAKCVAVFIKKFWKNSRDKNSR
jgi:hypothetical protein